MYEKNNRIRLSGLSIVYGVPSRQPSKSNHRVYDLVRESHLPRPGSDGIWQG